jgi:hypothetical protein
MKIRVAAMLYLGAISQKQTINLTLKTFIEIDRCKDNVHGVATTSV